MEKINYFHDKESAENFLQQFNFRYYVPKLAAKCRYCIELTEDLKEVYFCSIEEIGSNLVTHQDCFFDKDIEYMHVNGKKQRRYMTKEEGEEFYRELEDLSFYATLDKIYTIQEACKLWGKDDGNLRRLLLNKDSRLIENVDYKKSSNVWLITREAMEKLYGKLEK